MISLSTTQSIKLVNADARDVDVLAAWVDTADDLPASDETLFTTATTDTIVASPSSGVRQVDLINIRNRDTDSATVTVQQYNSTGTVTAELIKVALPAGFTLQFSRSGWQIVDTALNTGASFMAQTSSDEAVGILWKIPYSTELFDTHGWYDNSANSGNGYRFKPLRAGKYRFSAAVAYATYVTDGHYYNMSIRRNGGTTAADNITTFIIAANNQYCAVANSGIFAMNGSTDYVEVICVNETSYDSPAVHPKLSGFADSNFFCGEWVGD